MAHDGGSASTVEVHWVDLAAKDAPNEEHARTVLDEAERSRHATLRVPEARRRHALSHLALRRILGRAMDCEPAALRLTRDASGKPRLDPDGPPFNLAHSGDLALVALGGRVPLGVDLEIERPIGDLEGMIRLCCTPHERAALDALDDPVERGRSFLAAWVRKEAALKACGQGLRVRPATVETARGDWVRLPEPRDGRRWVHVSTLHRSCALAAVATLGVRCNCRHMPFKWHLPG